MAAGRSPDDAPRPGRPRPGPAHSPLQIEVARAPRHQHTGPRGFVCLDSTREHMLASAAMKITKDDPLAQAARALNARWLKKTTRKQRARIARHAAKARWSARDKRSAAARKAALAGAAKRRQRPAKKAAAPAAKAAE